MNAQPAREAGDFILEACVETRDEIDGAVRGSARRIELCSRLDVGGFTPTAEMVEYARAQNLNIAAMVRRSEGFTTGPEDRDALKEDIHTLFRAGADGLVFGYLTEPERGLDLDTLHVLLQEVRALEPRYGKKDLVFHMAFDELPEAGQIAAIDTLAALGFTRILTKGGPGRAEENTARLKRIHNHAQGKITILCGGGVTGNNYKRIAQETGITQFHGRRLAIRLASDTNPQNPAG